MEILKVPKLNENMDAAMVGPWAKTVGEPVNAGDIIVELVTDKATFELQAEEEGVLRAAAAPEKSTVPVETGEWVKRTINAFKNKSLFLLVQVIRATKVK